MGSTLLLLKAPVNVRGGDVSELILEYYRLTNERVIVILRLQLISHNKKKHVSKIFFFNENCKHLQK